MSRRHQRGREQAMVEDPNKVKLSQVTAACFCSDTIIELFCVTATCLCCDAVLELFCVTATCLCIDAMLGLSHVPVPHHCNIFVL